MGDTTIERVRRILSGRTKQGLEDSSLTPAAVLFLLYPKNGEDHILFNKRSQHVAHHKGEVSLPGGVRDPGDGDMRSCALRETWEEMGVRPEDVTVLGELDEVATRTSFAIHIFVGTIPYPYPFQVNKREVAGVLEVPLSGLLDHRYLREQVHLGPDGRLMRINAYAYNHQLIYGATARIVDQFLGLLGGPLE